MTRKYAPQIRVRSRKLEADKSQRKIPAASIRDSDDAAAAAQGLIGDNAYESFLSLFLNTKNNIIGYDEATSASLSDVYVDPVGIIRAAMLVGARALITVHQHPSGDLEPSPSDRALWDELRRSGKFAGVEVLDNLIVTNKGYFSEAENEINPLRKNPASSFKFEGTQDILDMIEDADPDYEYIEEPEEDEYTQRFHGRKVIWIGGEHYVLKIPVENVLFMEGNQWNPNLGAARLEQVLEGGSGKARFELPAARAYRITAADVKQSEKFEREGELEYQLGMVEPWEKSDIGDYYAQLIDGNHRAAAAMAAGEPYIYVYVGENYRDGVRKADWE